MPLIATRFVTSATVPEAAPTAQSAGYNVAPYESVLMTISELNDLDDYSFEIFGTIDDNDPDSGATSYPDATAWPEFDTLARTKTGSTVIEIPAVGVNRLAIPITAWTPNGGAPSLVIRLRGIGGPL